LPFASESAAFDKIKVVSESVCGVSCLAHGVVMWISARYALLCFRIAQVTFEWLSGDLLPLTS
jgi:hypothetical protein